MVRVTTSGGETVDFLVLSSGFGRDGPGVLSQPGGIDRYVWTTPAGRTATAEGGFETLSVGLDGVPSGRAETLEVAVSAEATLLIEADRPWIRLGLLAGGDPPGGALDHLMRGADRIQAEGAGNARFFGDGLMAEDFDNGKADVFALSGDGWRQAAGDFWLIPSTIFEVRMGDDDLRIDSRGRIEIWGDAFATMDKTGNDGALARGGNDRLDARDALEGVRRPDPPVLIGDIGMVGAGWVFRGGDDLLIAPREAGAALTGDVLSGDGQAHLYCGDDVLKGGRRDDILFGDAQDILERFVSILPGRDVLRGGRGADKLYGDLREAGPDMFLIEPARNPDRPVGNDRLFGGAGRDRVEGGWGGDRIFGGEGGDRLFGDAGRDRIAGEAGADRLWGGLGNDSLDGGAEGDTLAGNGGDDLILGGGGADTLHGGAGGDRIEGGAGDDRMAGQGGRDSLAGGAGDDRLDGASGRDRLFGGAGRDRLDGAGAADSVSGGGAADLVKGGGGEDFLYGGGGRDELVGGRADDRLFGGGGADAMFGGPGEDWLEGGAGADRLYGEEGPDTFRLHRGGGADVAEDFDPDEDWLSVERAIGGVDLHESSRGVIVSGGGASMLLLGTTLADLDPAVHDWAG